MAVLPPVETPDPTLAEVDRQLVERARQATRRAYLGMSAIGHPCERKLWYGYHQGQTAFFHDAATLKRFEDGHRGEALMAFRLRMVPGLELWTVDPETGNQFGFEDHDGRFKGHMDGAILGLYQAPKTSHVWEHKTVKEKKQSELAKLKRERGEKQALSAWDDVYYAQAVLYLHYSGMTRHYLTCSTPGERSTISVRSEHNPELALRLIEKARRILDASEPLRRISENPDWYQCKWCEFRVTCHAPEPAPAAVVVPVPAWKRWSK